MEKRRGNYRPYPTSHITYRFLCSPFGLTLIEIIIIVSLIAGFLALGMVNLRTFIQFGKLRADAWKVALDLRQTHQRAIIEHINHQVDFDSVNDTYTIDGVEPPDLPLHTDLLTSGTIIFRPMGNTADGSLTTITLQNELGETCDIVVFSTTGHVKIGEIR